MKAVSLPFIGLVLTISLMVGLLAPTALIRTTIDKELLLTYRYEQAQYALLTLLSLDTGEKNVYQILSTKALLNEAEGLSELKTKFDQLVGKNCVSIQATVPPGFPDLTGYNEGPTDYNKNQPQKYKVAVQNLGDVNSDAFNIKWFVDGAQVGFGSHVKIPKNTTMNNDNDELQHTFPDSGPHLIQYVIDVGNSVVESNEENNKISFYVGTTPQPEFLSSICDKPAVEFITALVLPYNKNSLLKLIRIGVE